MAEFVAGDEMAAWFPRPLASQNVSRPLVRTRRGKGGKGEETKTTSKTTAKTSSCKPPAAHGDGSEGTGSETTRTYFDDTYCFSAEARVVRVERGVTVKAGKEEVTRDLLVLDHTIFHPQGGGQPWDHGTITTAGGIASLIVDMVKSAGKEVVHYGKVSGDESALVAGAVVKLAVEEERRRVNARLHSAGHAIDQAMHEIGITYPAGKGYHFADGPYVEYVGKIDKAEHDAVTGKLQAAMDKLVAAHIETKVRMLLPSEAVKYCMDADETTFAAYPADEPIRIVSVGGDKGCPCGGTHVKNTSELGGVTIKGLRVKKGQTRVTYAMRD